MKTARTKGNYNSFGSSPQIIKYALVGSLLISLMMEISCRQSHSPYFEVVPWGPVSGERGNYQFSATAIDPDDDSVAIRFDWGDSTLSQWSQMVASGDTVTQIHFYGKYGIFQIKAQAMDQTEETSDWSDYHTFECATTLIWLYRYGGAADEFGYDVRQTPDNGYIIVGSTRSYGSGGLDVFVVKTSSEGIFEWQQAYGGSGDEVGYGIEVTADNNYVIVGKTYSYGSGDADIYVLKIQEYGNVIWEKTYGGINPEYGYDIQKTSDNGFIVTGLTASYGAGSGDVYLIKLNASGDSLWTKTYGGAKIDCGNAVRQTADGGYIITGYTYSSGSGDMDAYLIKTDGNGSIAWTKTYGTTHPDRGNGVVQTADGGYIVAGGNGNAFLLKYDNGGALIWEKTYGDYWYYDYAQAVIILPDNSIVFAGYTQSFTNGYFYEIYAVKTDATGNKIWERPYGGWHNDWGHAIVSSSDGNVVIAGYSVWELNHDFFLLKIPVD